MIVDVIFVMVVRRANIGIIGVSPGLGIKWRVNRFDMPAKTLYHFRNHMICSNTNTIAKQLHGKVPVAKVPGNANELVILVGMNFQQRLRKRADMHNAAIIQCQAIVLAQDQCVGKI